MQQVWCIQVFLVEDCKYLLCSWKWRVLLARNVWASQRGQSGDKWSKQTVLDDAEYWKGAIEEDNYIFNIACLDIKYSSPKTIILIIKIEEIHLT